MRLPDARPPVDWGHMERRQGHLHTGRLSQDGKTVVLMDPVATLLRVGARDVTIFLLGEAF